MTGLQAYPKVTASPAASSAPLRTLNASRARSVALLVITIAALLQLAIFFSIENLITTALLLCGTFAGLYYSVNPQLLNEFPLSTLAVLGYTTYYFVVPPIGKLLDFQSIVQTLTHPVLVEIYQLTGLFTLLIAHTAYRRFSVYRTIRWTLVGSFYRPLRFFEMPDDLQLWLMGLIGVAGTLVMARSAFTDQRSSLFTLVRLLAPLIYTPYFAAFPGLLDPRRKSKRGGIRLGLIAYSALLIAVASAVNSRGFMLIGFVSLIIVYGYRVITGVTPPPKISLKMFVSVLVCAWLISGPLTNMAASMLIARKVRGTVSPLKLVETTWNVYRSGAAVSAYEMSAARSLHSRSEGENYYNNIFLNRFGNLRFTDISIDLARGVTELGETPYFRSIQYQAIIAILPGPVIDALHLGIDKNKVLGGSPQDFLYQLAKGTGGLGGFRNGSPEVILHMTFGMMWPLYLCLLATVVFSFLDARSDLGTICDAEGNRTSHCVLFNPVVAGTLYSCLIYFGPDGPESLPGYMATFTRGWIELGLIYAGAFLLTKFVSSMILSWTWRGSLGQQRI